MNASQLILDYSKWIRDNSSIFDLDHGVVEITTPFLDSHNDSIQIYVKAHDDHLLLTDDGHTIADLEMSGVPLSSEIRKRIASELIRAHGVSLSPNNELCIRANSQDFPQKKHSLIQAMMAISNMFMLSAGRVIDVFKDDVAAFLNEHEIRFTADILIKGKSGLDHSIDFLIPKSSVMPDRFILVRKDLGRDALGNLLFSVNEMQEIGRSPFTPYVFHRGALSISRKNALQEYQVMDVPWSDRDQFIDDLVA